MTPPLCGTDPLHVGSRADTLGIGVCRSLPCQPWARQLRHGVQILRGEDLSLRHRRTHRASFLRSPVHHELAMQAAASWNYQLRAGGYDH